MMHLLTTFPNSITVNYFDIPKSYIPHMVTISKEINAQIEAKVEEDANNAVSDKSAKRNGIMTVDEIESFRKRQGLS